MGYPTSKFQPGGVASCRVPASSRAATMASKKSPAMASTGVATENEAVFVTLLGRLAATNEALRLRLRREGLFLCWTHL